MFTACSSPGPAEGLGHVLHAGGPRAAQSRQCRRPRQRSSSNGVGSRPGAHVGGRRDAAGCRARRPERAAPQHEQCRRGHEMAPPDQVPRQGRSRRNARRTGHEGQLVLTRMTAVRWHASPPAIQTGGGRRARKVGRAGIAGRPLRRGDRRPQFWRMFVPLMTTSPAALIGHAAGSVDDDVLTLIITVPSFLSVMLALLCGEDHLVAGIDQELLGDAQAVVLAD